MPPTGSRMRQARLNLTPLPSSSPASKGYHHQIQERAAAVDCEGSPAKRRKLHDEPAASAADEAMPTPVASRQAVSVLYENENAAVKSASSQTHAKSSRRTARQQQLDFSNATPLSSASHSTNLDLPLDIDQVATLRACPSDESDEIPSPRKMSGKSKRKQPKSNVAQNDGFMGSSGRRITRSAPEPSQQQDNTSEDDDIVVHSSRSKKKTKLRSDEIDELVGDQDTDEADMPTAGGRQPRKRKRRSSFISSSPPRALESDDDVQIVEKPSSRRALSDDDEDDDVVPFTPGRRKRNANPSRCLTQQEQKDLNEDLDFLGPSSDVDEGRRQRTQSSQKCARQKALERLKQKRSSQRELTQIDEDGDEDNDLNDKDEEGALLEVEYDESDNGSDKGAQPVPISSRTMFQAEKEDDDFLVDEGDDDELGIPDGIPLEFTRYASMKAKELWKFAIEWLVQKKINPAFPQMNDEIYMLAFRKLDDEVAGLVGSKFASAAWTTDFTIAFRSRPAIAYDRLDRNRSEHMFNDKCDACNRSGHPATYQVQFQGKPYHRDTLDDVDTADDSDNDDDSSTSFADDEDTPDYDAKGNEVKPASHIWYVGKFCMNNARTAHALQHWRLHLYHFVSEWIEQRYSSAEQLRKRDKMSVKKKRKLARKIADRMQEEGQTNALWKEFRRTLSDAASAKQQGRYSMGSP